MKKLIAAVVCVVMMISLFAAVSHANGALCVDGAYLTSNPDGIAKKGQPWVAGEGEKTVTGDTKSGDLGNIYGLGYTHLHLQGWYGDDEELLDFGYQTNDGDIVWGALIAEDGLAAAAGWAYCSRYNLTLALQEGKVTIKFYKKTSNGDSVFHTLEYVNEESSEVTYSKIAILDSGDGGIGSWVDKKNTSTYVEFTAAGAFNAISLANYWASNPNTKTGPKADWACELYKFEYNADYTLAKEPVKTTTFTSNGDANPAFVFDLGEDMAAGTYIVNFVLTNVDYTEEFDGTAKNPYFVLPQITNPDETKFKYAGTPFNLVVSAAPIEGDFFVANPEDTDAPAAPKEAVDFLSENSTQIGMSLDKIFWNGAEVGNRAAAEAYIGEDGTLDAVALSGESIGYHGWVCFKQDVARFGYMINGKITYADEFAVETDEGTINAVHGWGGDWANGYVRRFTVTIPFEGLTGTNEVCVVVELADGTVVKLNDATPGDNRDTTFSIKLAEVPQTGDMTVAMFAVILVLALGAAVVFSKKRAF